MSRQVTDARPTMRFQGTQDSQVSIVPLYSSFQESRDARDKIERERIEEARMKRDVPAQSSFVLSPQPSSFALSSQPRIVPRETQRTTTPAASRASPTPTNLFCDCEIVLRFEGEESAANHRRFKLRTFMPDMNRDKPSDMIDFLRSKITVDVAPEYIKAVTAQMQREMPRDAPREVHFSVEVTFNKVCVSVPATEPDEVGGWIELNLERNDLHEYKHF